jgi:hypothetical protein
VSEARSPEGDEAEGADEKAAKPAFRPPIRREAPPEMSRGLSAVEKSRVERNKIKRPPLKVIIWFAMTLVVALILYFRWESTQTESARSKLLSKQREAVALFGNQWFETRDALEAWTVELGGKPEVDYVDTAELANFDFRSMPGIYLRLRKDQAKDIASVREGAMGSLRDGFTSCLMHNKADTSPTSGKECVDSAECEPGQICNEFSVCAKPGQPYNLRLAYKAFGVLTPEWEAEARNTTNSLTIRALDLAFEDAKRVDFPIAVDLLSKARFFLVVIDERPPPVSAKAEGDAGPPPDDVEAAAGTTYPSRVGLYRLSDKKLLMRITREAKAELHGGAPVGNTEVAAALARQAQSCALANEVRKAAGR